MSPKRRTLPAPQNDPFIDLWREYLNKKLSRPRGAATEFQRAEWQRAAIASFRSRPIPELPTPDAQSRREHARHAGQSSGITRRGHADKERRKIDGMRRKHPRLTIRETVNRYLTSRDPAWDTLTVEERRKALDATVRQYERAQRRKPPRKKTTRAPKKR
jgi:hypothetical protein